MTSDPGLLIAAGWLHDIGYAPALASAGTGFHPLGGARCHRDNTPASPQLCRLAARHSCALTRAARPGQAADLTREFPPPPGHLADALTYYDMTTSPDSQPMPAGQRLAETCARYGPDHAVTRAITTAAPQIRAAADRILASLAADQPMNAAGRRSPDQADAAIGRRTASRTLTTKRDRQKPLDRPARSASAS